MRKFVFIMAIALFALQGMAQERPERKDRTKEKERRAVLTEMTPEQKAILQTKRLTLALDLNENQQSQLLLFTTQQAEEREKYKASRKAGEGNPASADDYFERMNRKLDMEIALQQKMKKILNEEQYALWKSQEKAKSGRHKHFTSKRRSKR
ncbi:hypothetical protein [Ascidiimonas aurantiaca]|uniref:hypothetical protein n=1 Tax=Ascidiimonas aurantiaca TaxID=1685432 RepID=UPI0030EBE38E